MWAARVASRALTLVGLGGDEAKGVAFKPQVKGWETVLYPLFKEGGS